MVSLLKRHSFSIDENLDPAKLSKEQIIELLSLEGEEQQQLFSLARYIRKKYNQDKVLLRGVIETSSYCQKNCGYCGMRATNQDLERYRLEKSRIWQIYQEIKETKLISVIFFQAGQDPRSDNIIKELIPAIKQDSGLEVLLCLGERPKQVYQEFAALGADSYILKFEIANPLLHRQIIHSSLEKRLKCAEWIKEAGMNLGTGNIVGLPNQTIEDLADDIILAFKLKPNFASSSPFIPNQDTPLEQSNYGNLNITLNTMAIYRIGLKKGLVPTVSALEKIEKGGQLMGLNAGANVITINFTPKELQKTYQIYSKKRFVVKFNHAKQIIKDAGLEIKLPPQK